MTNEKWDKYYEADVCLPGQTGGGCTECRQEERSNPGNDGRRRVTVYPSHITSA